MGGSASHDKLASANNEEAGEAESEEQEESDPLKKSLEKDFREAAENDADQAESPLGSLHFVREDSESPQYPTFRITPIHSFDKRPDNSYNNK